MSGDKDENPELEQQDSLGDNLTEGGMLGEPDLLDDDKASLQGDEDENLLPPADEDQLTKSEDVEAEDRPKRKGRLIQALGNADPFTVMLGVALLAILIAIGSLMLELSTYKFDIKASEYQQSIR